MGRSERGGLFINNHMKITVEIKVADRANMIERLIK